MLLAGSKSSPLQKPLTNWRAEDRHYQQDPNPAHHESHSPTGEPRTGIVSRVQIQLTTEATHQLENQGQVLSAGSKSSSPWKPLTNWRTKDRCHQQGPNPAYHGSHSQTEEPRTGIISRVKIQLTTQATHQLERHCQQGQNPAHHESHSLAGEQRIGIISMVKIKLTTEATHFLESQGQGLSAGSKSSSPQKPLTNWRAKDRHHQQGPNQAHHGSHSLPGELRSQPGQNPAHHRSHSPTGEPRTGVVSTVQIQLTMAATHFLESQGQASSVGSKPSSPRNPLTCWRAKDRHCQQGPNPAHHRSHSLPREPRTGIVSRDKI